LSGYETPAGKRV